MPVLKHSHNNREKNNNRLVKNLRRGFAVSIFSVFVIGFPFLYLNCGEGFKPSSFRSPASSGGGGKEDLGSKNLEIFGFGKKTPESCLKSLEKETEEGYNGCVFFKNPVFVAGKPITSPIVINSGQMLKDKSVKPVGVNNQDQYINYAVKTPRDAKGLDNENFIFDESVYMDNDRVFPFSKTKSVEGQFKLSTKGASFLNLVDYNIYYWLNHFLILINNQSKNIPFAGNKKIEVHPHIYFISPNSTNFLINAAWTGRESNAMIFGLSLPKGKDASNNDTHTPLALSSEIAAHEFGHAQLEYGANLPLSQTNNDIGCGNGRKNLCSKTVAGSVFAVHEGIADVYSYLMFDTTLLGEDLVNSMAGLGHCNNPRSMKAIKERKLTAQSFYDDCRSEQMSGEVHAMGSVYSTIWYGIIETARKMSAKDYQDAISFFYEHQKYVSLNDTFLTLKSAIEDLDKEMFSGKFAQIISQEYKAMGY